ncbi:MAG: hypothetical protein Q9168_002928 [Polycauliona sp. 1 TL-2023]
MSTEGGPGDPNPSSSLAKVMHKAKFIQKKLIEMKEPTKDYWKEVSKHQPPFQIFNEPMFGYLSDLGEEIKNTPEFLLQVMSWIRLLNASKTSGDARTAEVKKDFLLQFRLAEDTYGDWLKNVIDQHGENWDQFVDEKLEDIEKLKRLKDLD